MLLNSLFEQQAQRTPGLTALIFEGHRLTYSELDNRSTQLVSYLIEQGVVTGSLMALYKHRAPEMIVALLAVLEAGAAYVPLDTEYPVERLPLMLKDANPTCILTQAALESDLAYVIYTSGLTGMPKGVMNTHQGIYNRLHGNGYG